MSMTLADRHTFKEPQTMTGALIGYRDQPAHPTSRRKQRRPFCSKPSCFGKTGRFEPRQANFLQFGVFRDWVQVTGADAGSLLVNSSLLITCRLRLSSLWTR